MHKEAISLKKLAKNYKGFKVMEELLKYIEQHTTKETKSIQETILSMVCTKDDDPIKLTDTDILNALKIDGEFFILKLHYKDFEAELINEKIKYKTAQALSIVVRYEDDGDSFQDIKRFVDYIHSFTDKKQNSVFGVKKVDKLSNYPVTILFSGILPINQLQMSIGTKIYNLIENDKNYFLKRFEDFRDELSSEIGIPILPLFPHLDKTLKDTEVILYDPIEKKLISKFETPNSADKDLIEQYLLKLFYIYKVLAQK
jgi:hypothetical protein